MNINQLCIQRWFVVGIAFCFFGRLASAEDPRWRAEPDGSYTLGNKPEEIVFSISKIGDSVESTWMLSLDGRAISGNFTPRDSVLFRLPVVSRSWVRRELNQAVISKGPTLSADGQTLQLTAKWAWSADDAVLDYTLDVQAKDNGVSLRLDFQTLQEVDFVYGVQCDLTMNPLSFQPASDYQVYAAPSTHGQLGSFLAGVCRSLLIGRRGQRAYKLNSDRLCAVEGGLAWFEHHARMTLLPTPQPIPMGKKKQIRVDIGFGEMPADFPDDIRLSDEQLKIGQVEISANTVPQYGKIELTVPLQGEWHNPFDPTDVTLDAIVEFSDGTKLNQPGFFMIDHWAEADEVTEMMVPHGGGEWRVRICALKPGPVKCELVATDGRDSVKKSVIGIAVQASDDPGFVGPNGRNPGYLKFDNGDTFFPIGHALEFRQGDVGWVLNTLQKMSEHGENCNRLWMRSEEFGLEWWGKPGWYRQSAAAQLDRLVELGEQLGMYWIFTLDDHHDFMKERWLLNPYHHLQGGPCFTVADWFKPSAGSDRLDARHYQERRMRYIVARWGYSPHVFCWELGNELDVWNVSPSLLWVWHNEMTAYLAKLDPYDRLITTSFANERHMADILWLERLGLMQTHCYINNRCSVAQKVIKVGESKRPFFRPHLMGEFGINSANGGQWTASHDPDGWAVHNALWSAVASGYCGTPMPWWDRDYVDACNLYPKFAAVSRFVNDIPFASRQWNSIQVKEDEVLFLNPTGLDPPRPNALVAGLRCEDMAIVWIQNRDSTWYQHRHGHVPAVSAFEVPLQLLDNGRYKVVWWDTAEGEPTGRVDEVNVADKKLVLRPGTLPTDIAAKITPIP